MSDSITIIDENKVIDVVLIAGRILLEAGAETYRIEDTMNRIAHSYGLHDTYSFVTSTAIIFSLNDRTSTRLIRIRERTTDLEKIALTNSLSRKISVSNLQLTKQKRVTACLAFLNKSHCCLCSLWFLIHVWWRSFRRLDCMSSGWHSFLTFSFVQKYIQIKFFSEFVASAVVISIAAIFTKLGIAKIKTLLLLQVSCLSFLVF